MDATTTVVVGHSDDRTLGRSDTRTLGHSADRTLGHSDTRTLVRSDIRSLARRDVVRQFDGRHSVTSTSMSMSFADIERDVARAKKLARVDATRIEGVRAFARAIERATMSSSSSSSFDSSSFKASPASDDDDVAATIGEWMMECAREFAKEYPVERLSATSVERERERCGKSAKMCADAREAYERDGDDARRATGVAAALSAQVEYERLATSERGGEAFAAFARDALERARVACDEATARVAEHHEDYFPSLWNAADARLKCAEHAAEEGDFARASLMYDEMSIAYQRACGFADASRGDDLGGFLYDWGCSLTSAAQFIVLSAHAHAHEDAMRTIDTAVEKLKHAAKFSLGAMEPLNAIGDAYQAKAEIFIARGDAREAGECLLLALSEGFARALKASSLDLDANIGCGEVYLELGRLYVSIGDESSARENFESAWRAYQKAMANTKDDPGTCEERFGVVYNAACAANLAGHRAVALDLIENLIACGGATRDGVDADPDLRSHIQHCSSS